jgi:pimeloyl-ACP methyl ester carboxylesterase
VSAPGGDVFVRHWGEGKRPPSKWPRRLGLVLGVAVAVGVGVAIWHAVRPDPWRAHFVSCTYGGYVTAWCTDVAVPKDPSRPSGSSIELHVTVLPSTTQPAAGALFYLEGGPGGAATQSAVEVNALFAEVSRYRDVVMIDQRGTGGSAPLSCPAAKVPAHDAAIVTAYLRRCFAGLHDTAGLDTTSVAAADLEAVRRRLGYGKVDLYGGSYGATLAQTYLRLYPSSVRSVVLDSGSLPDVHIYDVSARNAERALDDVLARCARDRECHRAYPQPRRELAVLLARGPRRVSLQTGTAVLARDDVAWTVEALSESPSAAATIPYVVHRAFEGDYVPLGTAYATQLGADLDPRSRLAMYWVILCSEPWAGFDAAATARDGIGSYLASAADARARLFAQACAVVPRGRVPPGSGSVVATRVPALLLAGGADPLDPVANLHGWRRAFPNGRLVVVPSGGHGSIGYGCVQTLVARFVAAGTGRGLDTSCARRIAPSPFETG